MESGGDTTGTGTSIAAAGEERGEKLSPEAVAAMVGAQKNDSMAAIASAFLVQDRARAMDYYMGRMTNDMPTEDGRSQAVSTDVADTIEGLLPHLMDIFTSGDEVVKFEPVGPEDELAAQQETDYINHVFLQKNPGFMILYNWFKDALLSKVGFVKALWEEEEREQRETYKGLTDEQFALLAFAVQQSKGQMEIISHTERPMNG